MLDFTDAQIKHIAEELEMGMRAFFHKETGELITIPDMDRFDGMDTEVWEEDMEKVEANALDYHEIDAMTSTDSFKVMEDFVEQMTDKGWQEKLYDALNKKKPFSQFKYTLQYSKPILEQWYAYKDKRYFEWVKEQLSFYKMREKEEGEDDD